MKPGGGGQPSQQVLDLIKRDFGSFEAFVTEFKAAAATQFGSGWAWLVCKHFSSYIVFKLITRVDGSGFYTSQIKQINSTLEMQ